jgi:hypothetical protein
MAITGHKTSKEITRYTRGARQRTLAENAMLRHKVEQEQLRPDRDPEGYVEARHQGVVQPSI